MFPRISPPCLLRKLLSTYSLFVADLDVIGSASFRILLSPMSISPVMVNPDAESPPDDVVEYLASDSAFVYAVPMVAYVLVASVFNK